MASARGVATPAVSAEAKCVPIRWAVIVIRIVIAIWSAIVSPIVVRSAIVDSAAPYPPVGTPPVTATVIPPAPSKATSAPPEAPSSKTASMPSSTTSSVGLRGTCDCH